MATVVVMPALGNSVETCLIVSWAVSEGDEITEGGVLAEVETDKATMEVPSTAAGTVLKLLWAEGDEVPVMEPLLVVGQPGEDPGPALAEAGHSGHQAQSDTQQQPAGETALEHTSESSGLRSETVPVTPATAAAVADTSSTVGVSPLARNVARTKNVDTASLNEGTGPGGRIIERDVQAALDAAPATRAGARAGAVGSQYLGTGLGGRITSADLTSTESPATDQAEVAAPAARPEPDFPGPSTSTPLKGVRKVISERMMHSLASSAQLTYQASANAQGLLELRAKLKRSPEALNMRGITVGDLVGFAAVNTAVNYPSFNAHLDQGTLTSFDHVHLGFACDTPRGLLVPTVRFASQLRLREFSMRSKELAQQAIDGTIAPDLLQGATFTVSNLGSFGVEMFTPLLNVPQTAILGVNTIVSRATTDDDGNVVVEPRIGLSLTADHRVIDGADAARFLQELVRFIESIELAVLG